MRALSALSSMFLAIAIAGCAGAPPKQEDPLIADPPAGAAEGDSRAAAGTELDRAIAFIKNEKYADAKDHLKKAIDTDPKNAEARAYLGIALEKTGDRAGAEESYKKALEIDPTLADAAANLSALYLDDPPRPDEAIAVLKPAIAKTGDAQLLQNLAFAYSLKHDVDSASRAYEAALKTSQDPQLEFAYGSLLIEAKQPDKAAPHLKNALAKTKDDVAMLVSVGRMLGAARAFGDCVSAFDRAIKLKADEPEFYVRRGTCRHELDDTAGEDSDYQQAIKINPKFAAAHYYLGLSYLQQKKRGAAEAELKQAATIGADSNVGKQAKAKLDELSSKSPKKR